jgi:DNA-directed RNA polymerase subunit RPC12/RpoP
MHDINFDCPQCGQNLDAPEDMVGLFIECPACTKVIQVPRRVTPKPAPAPAPPTEFKPAPPRPSEDGGEGEKASTIRIQLPPGLGVPEKRQRRIVIKRIGPS